MLPVFILWGELYYQVQHLQKIEEVHTDLWYNRFTTQHYTEKAL